jgi:hypothetical protein
MSSLYYPIERSPEHVDNDSPNLFLFISMTIWVLVAVSSLLMFPRLIQLGQRRQELKSWIQIVRQERDTKIHNVLKQHTENENGSWRTAAETRQAILQGKLSASDNVAVLARRCRRHGRDGPVNAITEEVYDQANKRASNLNDIPKDAPLYGVPVCVKEWIGLQGTYATAGMACRLTERSLKDCHLIQVLKRAGAIPLCKGNVVQMLMLADSHNAIWGRTNNPWNLKRTPGGSSGGDAALVAMGCVPLSVSSDGAGSIRIPASYCGIVGFKPTTARSSLKGQSTRSLHCAPYHYWPHGTMCGGLRSIYEGRLRSTFL